MNSEVRIPTLLGFGILISGLVTGVLLTTQGSQSFSTQASASPEPKDVTLANLSSTSTSLYWQTDVEATGYIQFGEDTALGQTTLDERDLQSPQKRNFHFVTLKNLKPSTTYFVKLTSGSKLYPLDKNFTLKTTSNIPPSSYQPLIGTVVNKDAIALEGALVKLTIEGAQPLYTISKTSGNFILALTDLKNSNLDASFKIPQNGVTGLLTVSKDNQISEVTFHLIQSPTPLPVIILGQNQNLTNLESAP